ncbi:prolyl oligopeptidase family serine peptidase [Roseateles sp. P5_E7]
MKTVKCWAGVIAGFLLSAACAQAAPPPAEAFFNNPDILEAVLSPSGSKLAITSAKGVSRVSLVTVDLAKGGKLTRIAQFSKGDVYNVHWVNEDRLVYSIVNLARESGKAHSAPGLFAVNSDGSNFRQLVQRVGGPSIGNGSGGFVLNWAHILHRVPAPVPGKLNEEVLLKKYSFDDEGDDEERDPEKLLWINVNTGRTRDVELKTPAHVVRWVTNRRGEPRAVITLHKGKQAAWWRGPGSTDWTRIYESGLFTAPFDVLGVDDADNLYITHRHGPEGYRWLTRYDFKAGKPEDGFVVETPGFDFDGTLLSESTTGKAMGVRAMVDRQTTVWLDPQMKTLQAQADELLPGRVNRIDCRRCGQSDMVATVHSSSDHDPGYLYVYRAQPLEGEKAWQAIGPAREGMRAEQMAGLTLERIKARDGHDLPVWITRPNDATGPRPAVVLVHGGPWIRGRTWGWDAASQFLASRGYVVIEPEMRGSDGYGLAHFNAGIKQWGRSMQDDVADALRWAQAKGIASSKACIAGDSYGGYSALMGLINDPDLFRCGIAGFAVADLELFVDGSWWVRDDIGDDGRKFSLHELVGDPKKDAAMIAAHSPVKLAAKIKAPVMLVYGEEDIRVPITHGTRMREALRKAGNEPVWISYPDEAHGLGLPKNRVDYAQRMADFLATYLEPAASGK